MNTQTLFVRQWGVRDYAQTLADMRHFTDTRDAGTADELWLLQHECVFTRGQACRDEHLLCPGEIPVVRSDRGGQVTYHGPGQLVAYTLLDLKRMGMGVRALVDALESSILAFLGHYHIAAKTREKAPGVYVGESKIASLGLRVRRGCSFHGVAININMNLEPFCRINPCGYAGLGMTQLANLVAAQSMPSLLEAGQHYATCLAQVLDRKLAGASPINKLIQK